MTAPMDMSKFIIPKSDQLNAEDFLSGPKVFTVAEVKTRDTQEQPVAVIFEGGFRPWKPCKTTLRILILGWGPDASQWAGKSLRLYRDPSVLWAGKPEGGIRIAAMSHLPRPIEERLSFAKGKRAPIRVEHLDPNDIPTTDPIGLARRLAKDALTRGWTKDQITAAMKGRKIEEMTDTERATFLRDLMHTPGTVSAPEPPAPPEVPAPDQE